MPASAKQLSQKPLSPVPARPTSPSKPNSSLRNAKHAKNSPSPYVFVLPLKPQNKPQDLTLLPTYPKFLEQEVREPREVRTRVGCCTHN